MPTAGGLVLNCAVVLSSLVLCLASATTAVAAQPYSDHYCPGTQSKVQTLAAAVQRSPHHATAEIGEAAITVYQEYTSCAEGYRRAGNLEKYIFAVAQGSGMYIFAAEDFKASRNRSRAAETLRDGIARNETALSLTAGYKKDRLELRPHYERYRAELQSDLGKMRALLFTLS